LLFDANGTTTYTFGAVVDFQYNVQGDTISMTVVNPDGSKTTDTLSQTFLLRQETLTLNPDKGQEQQVMRRSSASASSDPLIGEWTYTHYTGGPAFMRYSSRRSAQLTVPMKATKGTFRIEGTAVRIDLAGQGVMRATVSEDGKLLTVKDGQSRESKYVPFRY